MGIAGYWQRIAKWYEANTVPGRFRLNPGASPAAIEKLEGEIGARLPDDFRESLLLHDGGSEDTWLLWFGELITLDEIGRQWRMYVDMQRKGEFADAEMDAFVAEDIGNEPIKPVFWNPKRIPVTDNSGDHLIIDLDPPVEGTYGQILEHSHEVGPERVRARNWTELLSEFADGLEAGRYVYIAQEQTVAPPGMWD